MDIPSPHESAQARKKRKDDAKLLKRQRIQEGGGKRPRQDKVMTQKDLTRTTTTPHTKRKVTSRFGRVMEQVPCRNQARYSTLTIAVPGSVVSNRQTRELKTQLVGQIARAAAIYHVDEIVVFDDKLSVQASTFHRRRDFRNNNNNNNNNTTSPRDGNKDNRGTTGDEQESSFPPRSSDPHTFMARVLQYCECPQYLRRKFFPMHPDLQFAGMLFPIDAPHHVRADDRCKYREGVVMDGKGKTGSFVNCGIWKRPVE